MNAFRDQLDAALADWLQEREDDPDALPGEFAASLDGPLREAFLRELEELAEIDRLTTQAPPRDLPVRFHEFRMLRLLGRGGMGVVYEAEHVTTSRRVALKMLHRHFAADARAAARFEREAHTAAALSHPRIARIHDYGRNEGIAWIAMDLVEGHSLQRLLAAALDPRDLDHKRARDLFDDHQGLASALADAADALEFAHRRGVVHRDVKPGNLMLDAQDRITVLDFGLASDRSSSSDLTRTGDFLGTPLYMSPEQASGDRNVGPASDIYSLGAVLYECLTGRTPVEPGPLPAILDGIRHVEARDPRRLVPDAPQGLSTIALHCLGKQPHWRYATAAELADDLRRFVDDRPVRARNPGTLVRTWRRVLRRPALAIVAAASVVLAVAGGWYGVRWRGAADQVLLGYELERIQASLALSPQGITVFGGAVRRWFETVGLGDHLPEPELAIAPTAREALARATKLADQFPDDLRAQRLLAIVSMDLGDDPARTRRAIDHLLDAGGADPLPRDRALSAVQDLLDGDVSGADRSLDAIKDSDSGPVHFFRALDAQLRFEFVRAIAEFDAALGRSDLDEELRYFSLLHRGWCRTCAEVTDIRRAEDDFLQAATLRPQYGTARLLWAGLRCLDPDPSALQSAVDSVGAVLKSVENEPWVVVLTARVLLAFAEQSTSQAGPVRFFAPLSPLASLPIDEPRRIALASTALSLLDGVVKTHPDLWEPQIHRIAALTLLQRHDESRQVILELSRREAAGRQDALLHQMSARVLLAQGRLHEARIELDAALAADPRDPASHLLAADLHAWARDSAGELGALRAAAASLPAQTAQLPLIQERIARIQIATGRPQDALATLRASGYGTLLSGREGPRARCSRAVLRVLANEASAVSREELLAELAAAEHEIVQAAPDPHSPLQSMLTMLAPVHERLGDLETANRLETAVRDGQPWQWWRALTLEQRGWLSLSDAQTLARLEADHRSAPNAGVVTEAFARACRTDPTRRDEAVAMLEAVCEKQDCLPAAMAALAGELDRGGDPSGCVATLQRLDACPGSISFEPLLAETSRLSPQACDALLRLAESKGADANNSEARLQKAAVLYARGDVDAALSFLAQSVDRHPEDMRARLLMACAAIRAGQPADARRALQNRAGGWLIEARELPRVAEAIGIEIDASVQEAVARLR